MRWWEDQDEVTKATMKKLVNEGRLEFVGGGWSMNDEACTHYASIIRNMEIGLQTLKETFGIENMRSFF